eukprot:8394395-Karenia_brevis.AAC.1
MSGPGSEKSVPDSPIEDIVREDSKALVYESFDSESQSGNNMYIPESAFRPWRCVSKPTRQ